MEQEVAFHKIAISKEIINDNVEREMKVSPTDLTNGHKMLCVSMDNA